MKNVLDFIKSHTVALACAVVALIALIAYFIYPIPSMFGDLQAQVTERKAVHDSLKSLRDDVRTLPVVDTAESSPKSLEVFPTERVIKAGEEGIQKLADQSTQALNALVKLNQRPLLVPGSLPNPPTLARQNFLVAYKSVTQQIGEGASKGIIATLLKGSLPPSENEIRDIEAAEVNRIIKNQLQIDGSGRPVNQQEVDQLILELRTKLPLEQRILRAKNSQIYVSPGAVDVVPELIAATTPPDPVTVFNGQFTLWVQSAVFEAIASTNGSSENVLSSPIKHLVRLSMNMTPVPPQGNSGVFNPGAPEGEMPPAEVNPDASAAITMNYAASPLGYTSNPMFDPIPVELVLRVDASKLPQILAGLQGGQLLKVKNVNYRSVDKGLALQQGYVYDRDGSTPMIEVTLACDVLMLRTWLVNYMPDAVKRHFGSLSSPAAPEM